MTHVGGGWALAHARRWTTFDWRGPDLRQPIESSVDSGVAIVGVLWHRLNV